MSPSEHVVAPDVRAEWQAALRRLEVVVCEYAAPALNLVNLARTDRRFGAGALAQWPDGSPYGMHPVRMALAPCGVECVFGDATVDVLIAEALPLANAWYPFGGAAKDLLELDEHDGYARIPMPADLTIFTVAFDLVALLRRALEETKTEGAA